MTDEIKKAMGCSSPYICLECDLEACKALHLPEPIVDLIKKQKAEIERLKPKCEDCAGCSEWKCDYANIISYTIQEFVKRLNEKSQSGFKFWVTVDEIDKVAKEMEDQLLTPQKIKGN